MIKGSVPVYIGVFFCLLLCSFAAPFLRDKIQQNQVPVVKIITPKNGSLFDGDSQVNYQISVVDKEDGDSKYEEINALEVLLEVNYVNNKAKIPSNKTIKADPPGLAIIRTSNCFNCHNFNTKAIGPSFNEIATKYPATVLNIDLLAKHIKEGSVGIWGKAAMPTHPELSPEETVNAVKWILKQAADPNVTYYTGTEGVFRTKQATGAYKKGTYVLTASYTDHGLKNSGTRLKGQDVVVLLSK